MIYIVASEPQKSAIVLVSALVVLEASRICVNVSSSRMTASARDAALHAIGSAPSMTAPVLRMNIASDTLRTVSSGPQTNATGL